MRKEAGDADKAEHHYDMAVRGMPNDADLALQRGHFYHLRGRIDEAVSAYTRAKDLRPDWNEPRLALTRLETVMFRRADVGDDALVDDGRLLAPAPPRLLESIRNHIFPEYLPTGGAPSLPAEGVSIRRLGRYEHSPWGAARTLQGIEAILAHCVTGEIVDELHILLGGTLIYREVPAKHILGTAETPIYKYVSNIWIDLSQYIPGRYHIELIFRTAADTPAHARLSYRDYVVITPPAEESELPGSESWIPPIDSNSPVALADQINARPSIVRSAPTQTIPVPRSILVLRTDQLGDLAISVPAIRRLRALAPNARLVGLFTNANVEPARALDLFDEVLVAEFPDIVEERQRVMAAEEQERLRLLLGAYRFDVAIDLAPAAISRKLLLLAGAKLTMGFGQRDFPWLGAAFDFDVRDERGRASVLPSSAKTLALVEALGTLFIQPEPDATSAAWSEVDLTPFGLDGDDKLVVLHSGARIAFSQWPYYPALASELLSDRDLKVILLSTDPALNQTLPDSLRDHPRFRLVDAILPFAQLRSLLSFCTLFIGNDTGPKHLASLLGTKVISIHSARTNWGEWGQSNGAIITRKVPCACCHIYHDPEECGRSFVCITRITVQEVLALARTYLN
jgi:ADP-heptose:LPS heptosyltransferase